MALRRHRHERDDQGAAAGGSSGSIKTAGRTVTGTTSRWAWPPAEEGEDDEEARGRSGGGARREKGPWGGSLNALDRLDGRMAGSEANWPQTEAELASVYQSAIMDQQQRHLEPLREDLADWLNKILGQSHFIFPFQLLYWK